MYDDAFEPDELRTAIEVRLAYMAAELDGSARQTMWEAEDGWLIGYTTSRIVGGGSRAGRFAAFAYRPIGKGARTDPTRWKQTYFRLFSQRKSAKARALAMFRKHSPRWDARHPVTTVGQTEERGTDG